MKHEISFVISVIFDIITVIEQARNQEFFRAGKFLGIRALINIPSTTHKGKVAQEIILGCILLDTLKSAI